MIFIGDAIFTRCVTAPSILPIGKGGTGATSVSEARTNLNVMTSVQLFYNSSGTHGTITLADTVANYNAVEIFHYENDYGKLNADSLKFWNNKSSSFDCVFTTSCPLVVSGENQIKFFSVAITVAGKTITLGNEKMITFRPKPTSSSNGQVHLIDFTSYATHQIYKVVGYKY